MGRMGKGDKLPEGDPRRTRPNQAAVTKATQDAFLAAFCITGSVRSAAEAVEVSRNTVWSWQKNDIHGFAKKYEKGKEEFREYLQDIAVDRVKDQKPNDNPVLLITLLNAHWPEKYRPGSTGADNAAKEIMSEWKKWVKQSKKTTSPADEEKSDSQQAVEEAQQILARKGSSEQN